MKKHLFSLLPPLVFGLILSMLAWIPNDPVMQPAAISPDLPVGYDLTNWYGVKTQESEKERAILSADTRFSKAVYRHINPFTYQQEEPTLSVSIVYSGNDINNSIHRPERCLPAQGHLNLTRRSENITLANGRTLTLHRLSSHLPSDTPGVEGTQHIHYYIFFGYDSIYSTHLGRTLRDMYDRVMKGRTQSWAYLQVGTYWGGGTDITEQQADNLLRALLRDLVPGQVDWSRIKN